MIEQGGPRISDNGHGSSENQFRQSAGDSYGSLLDALDVKCTGANHDTKKLQPEMEDNKEGIQSEITMKFRSSITHPRDQLDGRFVGVGPKSFRSFESENGQ